MRVSDAVYISTTRRTDCATARLYYNRSSIHLNRCSPRNTVELLQQYHTLANNPLKRSPALHQLECRVFKKIHNGTQHD